MSSCLQTTVECCYNTKRPIYSVQNSVKKVVSPASSLESQIINIKLKKSFKKVPSPPPKLSASGWRTGSNLEHCNITWYYINHFRNWGRISIRSWTHKRHPIPRPNGRGMGCLLWKFWRKFIILWLHCTVFLNLWSTEQTKNYTHGFCFVVVWLWGNHIIHPVPVKLWIIHEKYIWIYRWVSARKM